MERALFIIFAPQQMIVNRTGLAVLHDLPACERLVRGRIELRPRLDVQRAARRDERRRQRNGALEDGLIVERRIEKHDVERARCEPGREPQRVRLRDLDRTRAELVLDRTQLLRRAWMALDHHDARRAARRGLETQCAGAREQVEAAPAFEILAEPVEQRLAHAIGRRPQAVQIEHRERRAFPVTADDADRVRLAAAGRGRRAAGRGTGHTEYRRRRDRARAGAHRQTGARYHSGGAH